MFLNISENEMVESYSSFAKILKFDYRVLSKKKRL